VAYVVCDGAGAASLTELRDHLKERAPEYMMPARFVRLEEIPMTPSGKVNRPALRASEEKAPEARDDYHAPQTPVEEIVAGIYEEVLKLDRVGRNEDFFEIGGQSLLATKVVLRVRKALGIEIGVKDIFKNATPEGLGRLIEEALRRGKKDCVPPLVRAERGGKLPLSFAQRRLWFIDQMDPGNATYNISEAVRLNESLNLDALERAINEIIRRHEVLRTRIEVVAGEPAQVIDAWEPRRLEVLDLRSWPREEIEAEVRKRTREEAETGFDLSRGPLLRVKALKLEEEDQVILYTLHHIVSDGWSMGVLMKEVRTLYQAYLAGAPSPLEELEIQYADYAMWQRHYIQGEFLNEQLQYWRKHLGGELPTLKLIIDRPRLGERTHRAGYESIALPLELTRRIMTLGRGEGVTPFMTLLAAFKVLLSRYSGQEDIIVGTVVANRNSIEIEKLIGFFVNTLPLRTNLAGDPTFRELLARVREVMLGAYAHQDAPFEKLVDELQPARALNQTPLFRTVFTLQNAPSSAAQLPELTSAPVPAQGGMAKFDLTLAMVETSRGLTGTLQYAADLFDDVGIKKMLDHFRTLLENIVENPDQPLSSFRLLRDMDSESRTLSDFPDLQLSQRDIENILLEIDGLSNK
jgi:hypothetical protein